MKASVFLTAVFAALVSGNIWAQFCDDTACTKNCGISVDVQNPNCITHEGNRKSVTFHQRDIQAYYLVFSPGPDCDCQNDCLHIQPANNPCMDLTTRAKAQSFRFQVTTCKGGQQPGTGNNCKPTGLLGGNGTNGTAFQA
ncbi:hypothetical protein GGR52DRAFT_573315 [Hypoxylon sp. FL1284]|nr:hypothetical protein GGR52DRAFT_573315 [Hypoxylon sp. FL1284]